MLLVYMTRDTIISVRVPPDSRRRIGRFAKAEGLSLSSLIYDLLRDALEASREPPMSIAEELNEIAVDLETIAADMSDREYLEDVNTFETDRCGRSCR